MDPFLNDEAPAGGKFDPVQLLRMFWRRRWLFFVPFIICAVVAAVAIRTMTPIYESAGQIRVVYEFPAAGCSTIPRRRTASARISTRKP